MRGLEQRRSVAIPLAILVVAVMAGVVMAVHNYSAAPFQAAEHIGVLLALGILVTVVFLVPWARLPVRQADRQAVFDGIPAEHVERCKKFQKALRRHKYWQVAVTLPTLAIFGLTPLGPETIVRLGAIAGGSKTIKTVVSFAMLTVFTEVVWLAFKAWRRKIDLQFGLTSQSWGKWLIDELKKLAVIGAVAIVVQASIYTTNTFTTGAFTGDWWWLWIIGLLAIVVFMLGFIGPVVIAPWFNKFKSLPDGPLKARISELARRDGMRLKDVVVADASRRTNTINAHVMGFGPTRKVVIHDTLVPEAPGDQRRAGTDGAKNQPGGTPVARASDDAIVSIVAHEFAHSKYRDILAGMFISVMLLALMFCGMFMLGRWHWLLRWMHVSSITDSQAVVLMITYFWVWIQITSPLIALVRRRIEAAADWHSLVLTDDPTAAEEAFTNAIRTNLPDLYPGWYSRLFAVHPSVGYRIALARAYKRMRRAEQPTTT